MLNTVAARFFSKSHNVFSVRMYLSLTKNFKSFSGEFSRSGFALFGGAHVARPPSTSVSRINSTASLSARIF